MFNQLITYVVQYAVSFSTEFTIFALIKSTDRGFQHLIYDGYRFGIRKINGIKTSKYGITTWRCTSKKENSSARCNGKVYTKIIKGYEMLQAKNLTHECLKGGVDPCIVSKKKKQKKKTNIKND